MPARKLAQASPASVKLPAARKGRGGVLPCPEGRVIPTDRIFVDPDQPRRSFPPGSLDELAASLKTLGQLQPVRVLRADGGNYRLVTGERRWRAAQRAGLPTLVAIVHDGQPTPAELVEIQLVENLQREDLNPIDRALAFRRWLDLTGETQGALAGRLGLGQPAVAKALALLRLAPEVRALVEAGELDPGKAYPLAGLESPSVQAEIAGKAVSWGWTREQIEGAVRARGGRSEGADGPPDYSPGNKIGGPDVVHNAPLPPPPPARPTASEFSGPPASTAPPARPIPAWVGTLWLVFPHGKDVPTYAVRADSEAAARAHVRKNHPAGYRYRIEPDDGRAAALKLWIERASLSAAPPDPEPDPEPDPAGCGEKSTRDDRAIEPPAPAPASKPGGVPPAPSASGESLVNGPAPARAYLAEPASVRPTDGAAFHQGLLVADGEPIAAGRGKVMIFADGRSERERLVAAKRLVDAASYELGARIAALGPDPDPPRKGRRP